MIRHLSGLLLREIICDIEFLEGRIEPPPPSGSNFRGLGSTRLVEIAFFGAFLVVFGVFFALDQTHLGLGSVVIIR